MVAFQVLGFVAAVAVLVDGGEDLGAGGGGLGEMGVEVVDEDPGAVVVLGWVGGGAGEEEDGSGAYVELDPGGAAALGGDGRPGVEAVGGVQPAGRRGWILVVQGDCEAVGLAGSAGRRVAAGQPGGEPADDVGPEVEGFGAVLHEGLDDGDFGAGVGGGEGDVSLGVVDGTAVGEVVAGAPGGDAAQFENVVGEGVDLEDAAVEVGFDVHGGGAGGVEEVDRAANPPEVDLLGEDPEGSVGVDGDFDGRGRGGGCHRFSLVST